MQAITCQAEGLIYKALTASGYEVLAVYPGGECTLSVTRLRFPDCFHCGGKGTVLEIGLSEGWGASCQRCGLRLTLRQHSMMGARTAWDLREVSYTHVKAFLAVEVF
jgi:hypothetical protein